MPFQTLSYMPLIKTFSENAVTNVKAVNAVHEFAHLLAQKQNRFMQVSNNLLWRQKTCWSGCLVKHPSTFKWFSCLTVMARLWLNVESWCSY